VHADGGGETDRHRRDWLTCLADVALVVVEISRQNRNQTAGVDAIGARVSCAPTTAASRRESPLIRNEKTATLLLPRERTLTTPKTAASVEGQKRALRRHRRRHFRQEEERPVPTIGISQPRGISYFDDRREADMFSRTISTIGAATLKTSDQRVYPCIKMRPEWPY
jgi:hypothetical protein